MAYPSDVKYTSEHEWARQEKGVVTVGITGYASDQLGDVVFVELPDVGNKIEASQPFGVIEAVKTVSDLYAPVGGEIVEVNDALVDNPGLVNQEPYGEGWMVRIRPDDPAAIDGLMGPEEYENLVEEQTA